MLLFLHRLLELGLHIERRFDPFFRPVFDRLLRMPLTRLCNALINLTRSRNVPPIACEEVDDDENVSLDAIIAEMERHLDQDFTAGH